jgi:hypothetical protein
MKNWKTTSTGIVMVAGAIAAIVFRTGPITAELFTGALTGLLGGIGLIFAKDFDKTGK